MSHVARLELKFVRRPKCSIEQRSPTEDASFASARRTAEETRSGKRDEQGVPAKMLLIRDDLWAAFHRPGAEIRFC
jgi:hypothetical protein